MNNERHCNLTNRAAYLSEEVVRAYVKAAAAGHPRYGKALLKYGAAVGRLVQEATFFGGGTWRRAAEACKITHLGLAALFLQAGVEFSGDEVALIQEAARLSNLLCTVADTVEHIGSVGRNRTNASDPVTA